MLPNPKKIKTPDFILTKKGVYKAYDLKTIVGKGSAGTRMIESIGQTHRVLLNMKTDYSPRILAKEIKGYFEANKDALEVVIYKGNRQISISRADISIRTFIVEFMKQWH